MSVVLVFSFTVSQCQHTYTSFISTGDNLDIYVKTSNLGIDRRNKDLHLFTSNVLFSRVATIDMNNDPPQTVRYQQKRCC